MADLLNYGSYIFGNSVQYKPASVMAEDGSVVEVAREVFPASLQIPVRRVQVSAEVPRQVQQVIAPKMLGLTFFSFIVESLMLLEFWTPRVLVRPKLLSSTLFMVAFQQLLVESLIMLLEFKAL